MSETNDPAINRGFQHNLTLIRNPFLSSDWMENFLGNAPEWYKLSIISFLILNPILYFSTTPFFTGWVLLAQFIFTLALALKCYPLLPGGLLTIEAIALGMADTKDDSGQVIPGAENLYHEVALNLPVLLLLIFMVAGIYFMKDLLLFVFTKILVGVQSKIKLSVLFCVVSAVLSAFLDALTVTAVLISVCVGFYGVYHKVASGKHHSQNDHNHSNDQELEDHRREDLEQFRAFLRSLMMHGCIGTALGGVCTLIGEPQNLLIAKTVGWDFASFFAAMMHVTLPVFIGGIITCIMLEKKGWFGYGVTLPQSVREILEDFDHQVSSSRSSKEKYILTVQAAVAIFLVCALTFHIAEVGLIGLAIIVLLTAFNGITDEHQIGKAFQEALPFTALLVVFFGVVAVIHAQHLFSPIINWVLNLDQSMQPGMFFLANGLLSMISDNVFVATVYISEVKSQFEAGNITKDHFHTLAVAINTGTNLPSVATPNGQAAFLFLLTSTLAPLIRLSYGRMVVMALPYTIVLSILGFIIISIS